MMACVPGRRGVVLCVIGFLVLHLAAQQSRQFLGKELASKTGEFSCGDCFDLGFGSMACLGKAGGKLFTYNIRASIVARAKNQAYNMAYQSALSEGLAVNEVGIQAQKAAEIAAKATSKKAQRIFGPLLAAAWDAFEVMYSGGTIVEVSMRSTGTLCGAWMGGLQGEKQMGRAGYLVGSKVGDWVGSRLGLMLYDIAMAVQLLMSGAPEVMGMVDIHGKEIARDLVLTEGEEVESGEEEMVEGFDSRGGEENISGLDERQEEEEMFKDEF